MKTGISTWSYTWALGVAGYPLPERPLTVFTLLDKAHELGADVLQIADNLPLETLPAAQRELLRRKADVYGIALEVGTKGVRPERLIPFCAIARQLGSPIVRTLLHDERGCPTLTEAERYIREVLPTLHDLGLTLAVENHDFFSVDALRSLIEAIGDKHVGICLDPVNNLAQGESTNDVFRALGDYTVNFHCKDYTVKRKASGLGFEVDGCAVGDGLLDPARCAAQLKRDMSFIVELWTPWQGNITDTCALEDRWARQSMNTLHALKQAIGS